MSPVQLAVIGAALMMGHHVGAKSARDALFLSNFAVTTLPVMVIGASVFSLLLVLITSKAMKSLTPARILPVAFAASSLLYLGAGLLLPVQPRLTAVALFLLVAGVGTLITSGFWTLINERLDPNAVRRHVGQIAAGGTIGVILGGVVVERLGAMVSFAAILPVLGALHVACSFVAHRLVSQTIETEEYPGPLLEPKESERRRLSDLVRQAPYLHLLAVLVLLGTIGAGLIDYVFKVQSVDSFGRGESLLRFFAVFNSGVGLITFLLQILASRNALYRLGIGKTLGSLPATTALGSFVAMVAPGLASAGLARGSETVFRGSLFRAGYELFYAPLPVNEKRAAKPIIDVGFDRLGDGLAGGLVRLLLFLPADIAIQSILTLAVVVGLIGAHIALKLQDTYVAILEENLLRRAGDMDIGRFHGSILSSKTMVQVPISSEDAPPEAPAAHDEVSGNRLLTAHRYLVSGDPVRVRHALRDFPDLDPLLVPAAIRLLATDAVYGEVVRALRRVAEENVGQLVDALLDPKTDSMVRRRIPRALSHCRTQRAVEGLLLGVRDASLAVRYRCGKALSAITASSTGIVVAPNVVYEAVRWEAARSRPDAARQRILDLAGDEEMSHITSIT